MHAMKWISITAMIFMQQAIAGPFGLTEGMTVHQILEHGAFQRYQNEKGVYISRSMKHGHPDFELYIAIVSDNFGLCKVVAHGEKIKTDKNGSEIKSRFNAHKKALVKNYGPATQEFDFIDASTDDVGFDNWMDTLTKKDRVLAAYWSKTGKLPDRLSGIELDAIGSGSNLGHIQLSYEFINSKKCLNDVTNTRDSNL